MPPTESTPVAPRSVAPLRAAATDRVDVRAANPAIRAVVAVCGAASNAGKTWIAASIIAGLKRDGASVCALKVTRTHIGECPRGSVACGTCDGVTADFELVRDEARTRVPGKDTGRYHDAGADVVLWLLVKPDAMRAAIHAALAVVPAGAVLVAEGNSFFDWAAADVAVLAASRSGTIKESARHVLDRVSAVVRPYALPADAPFETPAPSRPVIAAGDVWPFVRSRLALGAGA